MPKICFYLFWHIFYLFNDYNSIVTVYCGKFCIIVKVLKFRAEIDWYYLAQKCANNNIRSVTIYKYYFVCTSMCIDI
jgi:hypothetical protein